MIPGFSAAAMMMGPRGGGVLWEGMVPYDSDYAIDASNYGRNYIVQSGGYEAAVSILVFPDYWQTTEAAGPYMVFVTVYDDTTFDLLPGLEDATTFDFGANQFIGVYDPDEMTIAATTTKAIAESYGKTSYNLTVYA